jgi:perosamine synthetase
MPEWSPHSRFRLYATSASYFSGTASADAIVQFENEICRRFEVAAAVCVPMARIGIYLALLETIRPGDKVVLSPLTIMDVVNAVILAGGIPLFCDIQRDSCGIDPDKAEALIDESVGAILITHLHGQAAQAHRFREIAERHRVPLIEDSAQAFGAIEQGRRLGTIGSGGVYSFGFFKNLSTWRGGMVVSDNREWIERIRRRVRTFPQLSKRALLFERLTGLAVDAATSPPIFSTFTHRVVRRNPIFLRKHLDPESGACRLKCFPPGHFGRMRPEQAEIALEQLDWIDDHTAVRIDRARQYYEGLEGLPQIRRAPFTDDGSHIYTYYPIQVCDRQALLQFALEHRCDFAAQHLRNCADLPDFSEFHRDCLEARAAAAELVLLPTYPNYPQSEVKRNVEVIRKFYRS